MKKAFMAVVMSAVFAALTTASGIFAEEAQPYKTIADPNTETTQIVINGADFVRSNWIASEANLAGYEPGIGLHFKTDQWKENAIPREGCVAQYKFKADDPGYYYMDFISSMLDLTDYSVYEFKLNDAPYVFIDVGKTVVKGIITSGRFYEYRYTEPVYIKKGVNILYIRGRKSRDMDDRVMFICHQLAFNKVKDGTNEVALKTNAKSNVFEESDEQEISIRLTVPDETEHEVYYKFENFNLDAVKEETIHLKGKDGEYKVDFGGKLPVGHYNVYASIDGGELKTIGYIAVTVDYETRIINPNTHFSVDDANMWAQSIADPDKYIRTLQLAGISHVRDRIRMDNVIKSNGNEINPEMIEIQEKYEEYNITPMYMTGGFPAVMRPRGTYFPTELVLAYQAGYEIGLKLGSGCEIEVSNEPDIMAKTFESATSHAAYCKAYALGIHDANPDITVAGGGIAGTPGYYMDITYQNEVEKFLDTYSFHGHTAINEQGLTNTPPGFVVSKNFADDHGIGDEYIYNTESGVYTNIATAGGEPTTAQQRNQGYYTVSSMLDSLAQGIDKHCWFIWGSRLEQSDKISWGTLARNGEPYIAYSALANMTYLIDDTDYVGYLNNLPENVTGYVFRNKTTKETVVVIWSKTDTAAEFKTNAAKALRYDLVGGKSEVLSEGGVFKVNAGNAAQYFVFSGSVSNVTEVTFAEKTHKEENYTEAERVILSQYLPTENSLSVRDSGYEIDPNVKNVVEVEVFNLNNKEMRGVIKGETYGGWKLTESEIEVTLQPFSKTTLTFELYGENVSPGNKLPLVFYGEFNGKKSTRTLTEISSTEEADYEIIAPVGGSFYDPSTWKKNMGGETSLDITSNGSGEITFNYNMPDKTWTYPWNYEVKNTDFCGTTGIAFEIYIEDPEDIAFGIFIDESDLYQYYMGNMYLAKGWNKIAIPWSSILPYSGSAFDANLTLDIDQISSIRLGFNKKSNNRSEDIVFTVRNFGGYYQKESGEIMKISNLTPDEGSVVLAGVVNISADINSGIIGYDAENLDVLVDDKKVPYKIENGHITASAETEAGEHTVKIRVRNKHNKVYKDQKTFMCE